LGHDQLDILVLQTSSINLLSLILVFILLVTGVDGLALAVVVGVVVASVVMSSVVVGLLGSQLLSGRGLGLGVEILDLGLTEDAV
jgi:hypothetical protein